MRRLPPQDRFLATWGQSRQICNSEKEIAATIEVVRALARKS
jgi:hypothetical protein